MARVTKHIKLEGVRASYAKVVNPGPKFDGSGMEYSMQVVIPKDHKQLDDLKKVISACIREAFPKLTAPQKQALKLGLRDNDAEGRSEQYPYLQGTMFINAKRPESFGPVPLFDRRAMPLEATSENIYSGCLVNVNLTIFTFDTAGSRGISCGLNGIQVIDNNCERWDGSVDPNSMFQSVAGSEEDAGFGGIDAPEEEGIDDEIPW